MRGGKRVAPVFVGFVAVVIILLSVIIGGRQWFPGPTSPEAVQKTPEPTEDPDYWTEERMQSAIPAPMPEEE